MALLRRLLFRVAWSRELWFLVCAVTFAVNVPDWSTEETIRVITFGPLVVFMGGVAFWRLFAERALEYKEKLLSEAAQWGYRTGYKVGHFHGSNGDPMDDRCIVRADGLGSTSDDCTIVIDQPTLETYGEIQGADG